MRIEYMYGLQLDVPSSLAGIGERKKESEHAFLCHLLELHDNSESSFGSGHVLEPLRPVHRQSSIHVQVNESQKGLPLET